MSQMCKMLCVIGFFKLANATQMKSLSCFSFLISFALKFIAIRSQTPPNCAVNNGGCSNSCYFDGNSATAFCSCPCGQTLAADGRSCNSSISCNIDLYVAIDSNAQIDPSPCSSSTGPYPNWESWRNNISSFLTNFVAFEAMPTNRVGVQLYSGGVAPQTLDHYTSSNLARAATTLSAKTSPICNSNSPSSAVTTLISAGDNFMASYLGPVDRLRDRGTTTRIAIVFIYQPTQSDLSSELLLENRATVLRSFNQIIVLTRTQTSTTTDEANTAQARILGCGNNVTSCRNVFWLDRNNDFDVPLSPQAVINTFENDGCNTNLVETIPLTNISCDNGAMTFTLALCPLSGLSLNMLQFADAVCNLTSFSTPGAAETVNVSLPFRSCGMTQKYVVEGGVVRNSFTQTIRTRTLDVNQILPSVLYTLTCSLSVLNSTFTSGEMRPRFDARNGSATDSANFSVTYGVYDNAIFTTPAFDMNFVIGCSVYVQASAAVINGLRLVLWSCWATPSPSSSNAINYTLANNGCPVDSSFTQMANPNNSTNRFSFEMFEFSSGYNKPTAQKPLIYVHCSFWICLISDTSSSCNPSCNMGRKRRSISENKKTDRKSVTTTFGPLRVEEGDIKKVAGHSTHPLADKIYETKAVQHRKMQSTTNKKTPKELSKVEQKSQKNREDAAEMKKPEKVPQRKLVVSAMRDEGYSDNDIFSSLRQIQMIVPTTLANWTASLWIVSLLLLTCLVLIIMYECGGKSNESKKNDSKLSSKRDLKYPDLDVTFPCANKHY